jgi:murein DD-endopeptidase MepM/ murein hydrolase activator NlpD
MRFSPRNGFQGALVVALAVAVSVPPPATAATGGSTAPAPGSGSAGGSGGTSTQAPAAPIDDRKPPRKKKRKKRAAPRPVLASFHADTTPFYDLGRRARVTFRIDGKVDTVRAKLQVIRAGKPIRTIDLGDRATGETHRIALTGREGGRFPQGALQLRLSARDAQGRGLRPSSRASTTDSLSFYWHRFPLVGSFDYGGAGSRFGADRDDHVHEGQDLTAPEGTPIVAPRAGVVTSVDYQAGGAGYYVILEAEGENRSYVFMHLREGSTLVSEGQRVATGERLGDVGSTGASSGPHLHFEIWVGTWRAGGQPIDPLPTLRRWDRWS